MRSACECLDSLDIALTKIRRVYSQIPVTSIHKIRDTFTSASRNFYYISEDSRSDTSRSSCEFYSGFDQGTSQGDYNAIRMEFPNLGEHCSESTCNRLDFLPLKCDACEEIFCTDHISYTSHSCPSAYKKNMQVPVCPLCNVPVPIKRGDPPDLAVGSHIDNDCQADFGKNRRKVFSNKCSSKGCKVKEMVQVKCSECGANFCLKHRHPTDHACIGAEEALRLRRLESLNKKAQTTISQSSGNSNSFRSLQGTISEDEALARALQASLQDEETSRRELQPVPSGNRDRCRLS